MSAKNPDLTTFTCGRCKVGKIEIVPAFPDSWLVLCGYGNADETYFCSLICMCIYLGQTPFGLEQMSVAIQRIVRGKYFGKTGITERIQVNSRKKTKIPERGV